MHLISSCIILFALLFSNTMHADGLPLPYLVREPLVTSSQMPVLVLLHGLGSNEQDLFALAHRVPDRYLVVAVRAPIEVGANQFAWYQVDFSTGKPIYNRSQEQASRSTLLQFIEQLKLIYPTCGKVYFAGFSQGAIMSYSIGLTRPDLVQGIAVLSGRLLEELKPSLRPNDSLRSLSIFIAHGTYDKVLDVSYARSSHAYLQSLSLQPRYKEYAAAHTLNEEMIKDLVQWLHER